jgi:hypothetical protein
MRPVTDEQTLLAHLARGANSFEEGMKMKQPPRPRSNTDGA